MKATRSLFRTLLVLPVLLLAAQNAWADNGWSVTGDEQTIGNNRYASFTITRTDASAAETVKYRTVSLTAVAGRHFEEKTGEVTFDTGVYTKYVEVNELDLDDAGSIYRYATPYLTHNFRFEVLDQSGAELTHCDRTLSHGIQYVNPATLFKNAEITAFTDPVTVDDAQIGFGQAYHAIPVSDYFAQTAPQAYLTLTGAKLAMSFEFQVKEKEDGYQYLQVLVDDDANYDSGGSNGDVGKLQYAQLLAGFGHDPGDKNTSYAQYAFPVPGITDFPLADYDNRWKNYGNTVGRLYSQKIKPGYLHEESGRVLADAGIQKLGVRFSASGKNDDTWYAKDFKAFIQAVDGQNPTIIAGDVRLSPAPYAVGSTVYVSVPFSEIVLVNGSPKITTNWGDLTYNMGSGTNVLVFKGTIGSGVNPTETLTITALSGGPVRDLQGNPFTGQDNAINVTFQAQASLASWTGSGTEDNPYVTGTSDGLTTLATCVNMGIDFGPDVTHPDGYFFKLNGNISYNGSTTNNYTAIGSPDHPFRGHFDGGGFIVKNINIDTDPGYQGLFGYVGTGGTVKDVTVANSYIKVRQTTSDYAAGIVGCCAGGSVSGCFVYNTRITYKGGSHYGPVVGNDDATQEHNYYRDCHVESETMSNVFSIKVDKGVTVSSPVKTYYDTGYFIENAHVKLFAPVGKAFSSITVTRNSDQSDVTADVLSGTTIIMPAYDITVSSPLVDVWGVTDYGADGSEDHPYIISTAAGWDALATAVNGGETFTDTYFKLSDDFDNSATPVTTMAGCAGRYLDRPFKGTFLGNGRTLTVNLETTMEDEGCAPFFRTNGATIKNLRVAGTVTTDEKCAAGIVSHMKHSTLEGCVSSVTIISSVSGDGSHGGLVGVVESGIGDNNVNYIKGCVFDGVICCTASNLTGKCGGIAGWAEGGVSWGSCLYAPSSIPDGKYPLDVTDCSTIARNSNFGSYYTEPLGDTQNGRQVFPLDTKPAGCGDETMDYGLMKVYDGNCVEYNGHFYVESATITLNGRQNGGVYWTTYYNSNVRFLLSSGAAAYTMGTDCKLYRLGSDGRVIPAGVAVVILSDVAEFELNSSFDQSDITDHANGGNILRGFDSPTAVSGTPCVLGIVNGQLGFYKYTGGSIPAHKAYYLQSDN